MKFKKLKDEHGCILSAYEKLPSRLVENFVRTLAELENNDNHAAHSFPFSNLHKIRGINKSVYRAYIDKTKGWRLHVQLIEGGYLYLNEVLPPNEHDDAAKVVKMRKDKYV